MRYLFKNIVGKVKNMNNGEKNIPRETIKKDAS